MLTAVVKNTTPHEGQKPGTSGLRKKVKVFQQQNYTENFIQSILNSKKTELENSVLIVGGDGRFFGAEAIEIICKICAANKVSKVLVGQHGVLSTPAVSNLIRKNKALGGILLTASHNPGGPENDFGIKFNCENGGPAPDNVTNDIFEISKIITEYKIVENLVVDISKIGSNKYTVDNKDFTIEIIDSVNDYLQLMKEIFDFDKIKNFIKSKQLKMLIDSMSGVTGPYVNSIFVEELGAQTNNVIRTTPLTDFGGCHPDPNLTYAKDLVDKVRNGDYDIGAAFDGDGDRNMIIGHKAFFVTPSDSLAVIAHYLECIPYFKKHGVQGFARSMPTASAIDLVGQKLNKEVFEVPTGWKYFGNLMDAGRLCLCGEESFGTGSNHIREKDGIWAVLAWLSIMENTGKGIEEILNNHWEIYGRNYFTRYDYEECELEPCNEMISTMEKLITEPSFIGKSFTAGNTIYKVKVADNFSYIDPVDKSVANKQGLRIVFEDGSRIVMRLSGTGSSGATVRLYIDSYSRKYNGVASVMLKPLIDIALEMSQLKKFTKRDQPTVIT
ncbi:PGM1 family protein [Megaselia abdita]